MQPKQIKLCYSEVKTLDGIIVARELEMPGPSERLGHPPVQNAKWSSCPVHSLGVAIAERLQRSYFATFNAQCQRRSNGYFFCEWVSKLILHRHLLCGLRSDFRELGVGLGIISLTVLLAVSVFAESWENKDWTQWSSQDLYHILEASPWAVVGPEVTTSSTKSPGRAYDSTYIPTAQMVSSLVVRQALVRQAQLLQHYDKMKPQEKQQFDQMAANCLSLKLDDRIIVRGTGLYAPGGSLPDLVVSGRTVHPFPHPQGNAISPCPYILGDIEAQANTKLPADDVIFPRVVDGKPVIQPDDKNFKIGDFTFNAQKMIYKGKLDY